MGSGKATGCGEVWISSQVKWEAIGDFGPGSMLMVSF